MTSSLSTTLSIDDISEILHRAAELLEAHHVVPETGVAGAEMLRAATAPHRYRHLRDSPGALAELLTLDLRLATGDGHVFVEYLGNEAAPADDWIARWRQEGPSRNWGVNEVRLLPGNIGLLKLTSFYTYDLAVNALSAAMELIRHTEGLVLDLTDNGGGDDATADAVMDTFLEPDAPRPLILASRDQREPSRAPTDLAWPHYGTRRPMTIMTGRRTFSAPEAVAYALQQEQRAIVVGSPSAGGANMIDEAAPLPLGFRVGIPNRRPVGRITGSNWEGLGVQPDVEAPGDAALWQAWETVRQALNDTDAS